jgi:lantibiotic modifying enzyme
LYLDLYDATADARWLQLAVALAPTIAAATQMPPGDIIGGLPGQGLLLLRLHATTGDTRWLHAAHALGDVMLSKAVPAGGGIKFPAFNLTDGRTVFYTGMGHGAAGAGYFLARLGEALGEGGVPYIQGAARVARWLIDLSVPRGAGINVYRREPDQMEMYQVQWCHGSPGIGIFFAELYRVTNDSDYLALAKKCATVVDDEAATERRIAQCHGLSGNGQLFLKLHRITGDAAWLEKAIAFGDTIWAQRVRNGEHPLWRTTASGASNPGIMTGMAGIGWYYLALSRPDTLAPGQVPYM